MLQNLRQRSNSLPRAGILRRASPIERESVSTSDRGVPNDTLQATRGRACSPAPLDVEARCGSAAAESPRAPDLWRYIDLTAYIDFLGHIFFILAVESSV
jgi:hypothetical protein